ncbi:hypothetical protein ACEWPM_010745 [Roseovarius sp. S4756]|uniref:hypothetical protein n=1 Tax=Roseovarius maritimus TaxID=3342637 RepID=UPI0037271909
MPSSETSEIARIQAADQLGVTFAKTLITMNAGAILALLTFIAGAKNQSLFTFSVWSLQWAMALFLAGIVSILLALLVSYYFYAHPPESKTHQFLNKFIAVVNAFFAFSSTAFFVGGVILLLKNIIVV